MKHSHGSVRHQHCIPVLLAVALCIVLCSQNAVAQWRVVPQLSVAGGDESDLIIDPQIAGAVVPGGPFAEITPAITARYWPGEGSLFRLAAFATLQRFLNEESRLLYAQTVSGDALWNIGSGMRGRLSLAFDFFDDSGRESVRRMGLNGEAGLAWVRRSWSTELWVGGRGRRYPNIDVLNINQQVSTYAEATFSGGAIFRTVPHERVDLGVDGVFQQTDSRDPFFDSQSWAVTATADVRIMARLFGTAFGSYQDRHFSERATGEDHDDYSQLGAGMRYPFNVGWDLAIRWGYAIYTWPDGTDEDSHRLAIGIRYTWGRKAPPVPRIDLDALVREGVGALQRMDSEGTVRFRVHAPGAQAVSVAGTFNEWNTAATPLQHAGSGWWETRLDLSPGTYEYAYIIDGKWITPPEALLTVEDGFGGTNGILEVLPPNV